MGCTKQLFFMRTRRFDPFNSMRTNFLTELVQGVFWSTVISKQNSIHRFQVCMLVKVSFFICIQFLIKLGAKTAWAKMAPRWAKVAPR